MLTYLLPTRNRPDRLAATLRAVGNLSPAAHEPLGGAEVVIVDDASSPPAKSESTLRNGMPVTFLRLEQPEGAAARNAGARLARGEWIVMLDDDSWPAGETVVEVVAEAGDDVAVIGAEVLVADGQHEAGGLPEVFVGCGAAVRREAFLAVGGYDRSFHYYAEEYDLSARLLMAGWRIAHDWRWTVRHAPDPRGRDMNLILRRLVRNSGWVIQRYAPEAEREVALARVVRRYAGIARKENALKGYQRGLHELKRTRAQPPARSMSAAIWDRFTGLAHVRATLQGEMSLRGGPIAIVDKGKHAWVVRRALEEFEADVVEDEEEAGAQVIGTISPGPMMDAWSRRRRAGRPVIRPWRIPGLAGLEAALGATALPAHASAAYDASGCRSCVQP